jgi:hypothetical protein
MCLALTVARGYAGGGDRLAALVARLPGWKLFDGAVIEEGASLAPEDPV